jgi:molybdopterin molybdotransferase
VPFSVEEAAAIVVDTIRPLGSETVSILDANERVLADDIVSSVALPPWDNASMDGYALRAADIAGLSAGQPVALDVSGTIAAGGDPGLRLVEGRAMRIMTGAPVPAGADSVMRVEDTDRGTERVEIRDARDSGRNIRRRGEDIRADQTVGARGAVLSPGQLGVLASVGASTLTVFRRPRVALLVTGDEIVNVEQFDEVRAGRRIVSSNSYSLRAAIMASGADVLDLGIGADDRDALIDRLRQAAECDLIVTSGGVSAGAFDYTRDAIRALGGTILVDRVRMRPGAPFAFGTAGASGPAWLGLPGNPVSALVTFEVFGRIALRRLRGERLLFPMTTRAIVDERIELAGALTHFLRAVVSSGGGGELRARLTGGQGSGILTSMALGNALLVVAAGKTVVEPGESLPVLILGNHSLTSDTLRLD